MKENIEEYLQQGIHGAKEIKPDERRRFLGSLRERVVVALTKAQVRQDTIELEFKRILEENKEAKLYLNGNMNYPALSKYIQLAEEKSVGYKIVTNKEHDSEYGLVLAYDYAIDKEDITLAKAKKNFPIKTSTGGKGFGSFVKTLFRKR
ncbi:DUF1694 domain-containing protein [Bacillus sp. B15-48]|nr:DUF1694 domain-containing protein [Bacillus sp. B15-48]